MRTDEEIIKRINDVKDNDFFGFETADLIYSLQFSKAKQFLKDEVSQEDFDKVKDNSTPSQRIMEYIPFAWDKANNCRGLSAARSLCHMKAWLWLDGKDDLVKKIDGNYEYYGKPLLAMICDEYGINWRQYDDGKWRNEEDDNPITAEQALGLQ